jgi:small conductance mechanosensitive channel
MLGRLPQKLGNGAEAVIASFPDSERIRLSSDLIVRAAPGWVLVVAVLLAAWGGLRARRARKAIEVRTAPLPARRAITLAHYAVAACGPILAAAVAIVCWVTITGPTVPVFRMFLLVVTPFLCAVAAMAAVSISFTTLSAFGRRADRSITQRLPPQIGAISALLIAALLLRAASTTPNAVWNDALALMLETLAALISLRAIHEQRLTLRQLLKAESATPSDDPPTLPERLTSALADRWHLLGYALVIISLLGRYGLFGPERRFGLFPDLLLSLGLLGAAGLAVFLTERLHGHFLSRMNVTHETSLRSRLALRLGRVLRSGAQVAIAIWGAGAVASLWGARLWQDGGAGAPAVAAALVTTLLALFALWFIWTLVDGVLDWSSSQTMGRSTRIRTLLPFLRNFALIVVATLAALSVLSNLGVDVAPLLAGAGIVGIAIGIGAQKLVGDVITGIFIIFEDSIAIGETVEAAGKTGVVEGLTIRTLKLRDGDGAVHSIPFSSITTLKNASRGFGAYTISVTVLSPEDTNRALAEVARIGREISEDPDWKASVVEPFSLWGVDQVSPVGVVIKGNIRTSPNAQWALGREINRRIAQRFAAIGIAQVMPPTQWGGDRLRSDAPA